MVETPFDVPYETGLCPLRYDDRTGGDAGLPRSQSNCLSDSIVHSPEFDIERERCDANEFGCQFISAAPNVLCEDDVNYSEPTG